MTSLTDVYEREVGEVASRQRVIFGLALFAVGTAMVVAGIAVATTALGDQFGLGTYGARELAGVLAGLGLPTAFLGSFAVLPASRRTRAAAVIGTSLAVLGVTMFREAYPVNWIGSPAAADYTMPVLVVYFLGTITTFWCLFLAIANFKTRNDPGGTVTMQVTEEGTTILEVSGSVPGMGSMGSMPGLGSVGMFGTDPDGEVETQTARPEARSGAEQRATASDGGSAAATGGGESTQGPDGPDDALDEEVVEAVTTRGQPDAYCGNCEHFQYVRVDGEIEPACTLHSEVMDDMDACDEWQANSN
jgi:cytochrome c biogenesis protein CcdA